MVELGGRTEWESNKRDILLEGAIIGLGRNVVLREIPRNPQK